VNEINLSYISLTEAELKQFDYQDGDVEGLVNYALSIAGAEVGVLLTEKQGKIRMSFRSKGKYSVNKFARTYFEGGGHEAAAGGVSNLSMNETIEKLLVSAKKEWQN
jgi:phosphoesterase RecJ-like protein